MPQQLVALRISWHRKGSSGETLKRELVMKIKRTTNGTKLGSPQSQRNIFRGVPSKAAGCALLVMGAQQTADAQTSHPIPIVTISCYCSSFAQLEAVAYDWFLKNSWLTPTGFPSNQYVSPTATKPGTLLLISSTQYALSAAFRANWINVGGSYLQIDFVTPGTDKAAIALDGKLMARATGIPPIKIPPSITPQETPEIIGGFVSGVLVQTGTGGFSLWHGLFPGTLGQVAYINVINTQTGQTYKVWSNDEITIKFSNNWTAKMIWSPFNNPQWQLVPNSIRDDKGNVPGTTSSTPTPNGPSVNLGSLGGSQNGTVIVVPDGPNVTATIIIGPLGDTTDLTN